MLRLLVIIIWLFILVYGFLAYLEGESPSWLAVFIPITTNILTLIFLGGDK